ncbi:MAG TPA: hypothetical protein H9837_11400, partial [Candidatus Brachybacterium merdigallinarum]|nr:hypothetical protein [Candidatus Brachybacterium merdigallinarum]
SGSVGAPLMILAATLILLLFSVGFTWMTPHVPDAGAFYAYVHQGLGRRAGLGTAAVALLSYVLLTVSMTCCLGVQAGNLLALWTGIELPWWLISAVMIAVVGVLAPAELGQVHPVHRAPSRASLCVTGITAVIVLVSALAVLRFGGRRAGAVTLAATGLGGLGLFLVLGISLANFPLMAGGTVAAIVCAALLVGAFALGAVAGPTRSTGAPEDGDDGAGTGGASASAG